ncbi:MAG: autoinducer binding domain-containing protein [Sphingomonadales bacterium]|nr:autoinducer binding domain-containing protein [Sphingomonadales bacterium]
MSGVVTESLSSLYEEVAIPDFEAACLSYAPRARDRSGAMQRPTLITMSSQCELAPWWGDYYLQHEHYKIDPVYQACLTTTLPVWWGYDTKPNLIVGLGKTSSAAQVSLFHSCAERVGVRSGVSIPLHSALGGFGYIVFPSCIPIQELLDRNEHHQDQIMSLAHRYFAKIINHVEVSKPVGISLSAREVECLTLAAHGKTLEDIAVILDLSERTVRFHLGNACDKLGTVNRTHAIARASYLGLLGPIH